MAEVRIAIIGIGKIAVDQHIPAIAADPRFRLVAATARSGAVNLGVPVYRDHREMLQAGGLDAVAICTPPSARHALARDCLQAGLHVLLEKPPGTTLGEVNDLASVANERGKSLFTAWHAQANAAVDKAATITHREAVASMEIEWLEDVEKWHPGQSWIWQPGGFGVFDAGINALSIATRLVPTPLILKSATFGLAADAQQPIAARLFLSTGDGATEVQARFDWRHRGAERWTIDATTRLGSHVFLSDGGATIRMENEPEWDCSESEYASIYDRFSTLISCGRSLVDSEPLRLMADAFLAAERLDCQLRA